MPEARAWPLSTPSSVQGQLDNPAGVSTPILSSTFTHSQSQTDLGFRNSQNHSTTKDSSGS